MVGLLYHFMKLMIGQKEKKRNNYVLSIVQLYSYAAQMCLRKSGNVDNAYVIKNITCTTPNRPSKYKKSYKDCKNKIKVISNEEALSLLIEAQLTKHQYNLIRTQGSICDGSSGQSEYKQVFNNECDSDSSIFFTSVVPLQLVSGDLDDPNKIILWQNPRPSSSRYCRPIKIQFIHETVDITLQEMEGIENQIEKFNHLLFIIAIMKSWWNI
ncbi:hypothetical protein QTP88_011644 [Uroleucon formosanum]